MALCTVWHKMRVRGTMQAHAPVFLVPMMSRFNFRLKKKVLDRVNLCAQVEKQTV